MTLTLNKQLLKIIFRNGSIGTHINHWNKVMSLIVEKSPNCYTEWRKLDTFKASIKCKELQNMQDTQVINDWDIKKFQHQLRRLEILHQEDFGVINFSKYSTKNKTIFQPLATPILILAHDEDDINNSYAANLISD